MRAAENQELMPDDRCQDRKDATMKPIRLLLALAIVGVVCFSAGPAQEPKVTLTAVKYDQLKHEILKHRGRVVVVDFWATFCPPCKKSFPHFIDMQAKYASKGIVVISVSLDDANDPEKVEKAQAFLAKVNSPLRNFILDEPFAFWEKKFESNSLPFYYLFDRRGKWVRYRGSDYADGVPYDELEKVVVKMLDEK
jgi:thiol-disulfide isomerase/thioredoxin